MATNKDIVLGDRVRDSITGFEGIVVARTEWLNGCWRIGVQAQELRDGKPIDHQTFDVDQLELVEARGHQAKTETGGPRPDATQRPPAKAIGA